MEEQNINEIVENEMKEILTGEFHTVKMDGMEMRLFKSLHNSRCPGETFDEYKVRLKLNKKLVKKHLEGRDERKTRRVMR